jgi:preprotein translocase subunit SecF
MKTLQAHIRYLLVASLMVALCVAGSAGMAQAQSTQAQQQAEQQARANQVRDQLRANALREQQRQQTSDTLRKAFKSNQAQQGIDQADQARRDRNQAQQRNRVADYLHREQAAATAGSSRPPSQAKPANPSSSH